MRHKRMLLLACIAASLAAIADAREARGLRGAAGAAAEEGTGRSDRSGIRRSYGAAPEQRVLIWPAAPSSISARPPLAVYIHGGGWSRGEPEMVDAKPEWFHDHGWAFASIGYRMLPGSPVEEQARDVGRALGELRRQAAAFGYDPDRILLLGHSAGAHLSGLVSTDPSYAADSFAAIRGTILIDGACYDVPAQIAASPFMARRMYIPAFGSDPARQTALSPITHAGGRDVPDWLLLSSTARDDAQRQSATLAAALRRGGAATSLVDIPARSRNPLGGHMEANREFGSPAYAANPAIEAMMMRIAGTNPR